MSRRICVELYLEIARLRPAWHHEEDERGALKVVMTGSASDPLPWQQHIRSKARREALAKRFRAPHDPFQTGHYIRPLGDAAPGDGPVNHGQVIYNMLVPFPEVPQLEQQEATKFLPPPMAFKAPTPAGEKPVIIQSR